MKDLKNLTILTKFVEVSEECETKGQVLEAELEEKRREQERSMKT